MTHSLFPALSTMSQPAVVDLGPNHPLSLQVKMGPQDDFKLLAQAIGVLGAKRLTSDAELPLPLAN